MLRRLSASPLRHLTADAALQKNWPPTLVLHGQLDGIVPVEHSLHFLSSLVIEKNDHNVADTSRNIKEVDIRNVANEISANSLSTEYTADTVNRKMKDYLSNKYQSLPEEISNTIENPVDHADSVSENGCSIRGQEEKLLVEEDTKAAGVLITDLQSDSKRFLINGEMHLKRDQDDIIIIPGAKHSFEAVGGELVDIVADGLIDWLSEKMVIGIKAINSTS